jgi:hypothetical protein
MNAIIAVKGWRADVKETGSFLSSSKALMAPLLDRYWTGGTGIAFRCVRSMQVPMSALVSLALVEDQKPRRL